MAHAPPTKWNPPPPPPSPAPPVAVFAPVALLVDSAPPAPPLPLLPATVKQLPATQIPSCVPAAHFAPSSFDRTTHWPCKLRSHTSVSQIASPSPVHVFTVSAPHLPDVVSHVPAIWHASLAGGHATAPGAQTPVIMSHVPATSHLSASGHFSAVGGAHAPVVGSQAPATMQFAAAGQVFAGLAHAPPTHASSVHRFTSPHAPAGAARLSSVHVPSLDAPLALRQVWHAPPAQAESQHTPSTQFPTEHSAAAPHCAPIDFVGAQLPATQYSSGGQSVSRVQDTLHTDARQPLAQACGPPGTQTPLPLQNEGPIAVTPLQLPLPHPVLATAFGAHAPLPLQNPGASQSPCGSGHSLSGSLPATMLPHTPSTPVPLIVALHAMHAPAHAVSQQTPSTHDLWRHAFDVAHAAPSSSFGPHMPAAQNAPVMQSPSLPHVERHAPVEHW